MYKANFKPSFVACPITWNFVELTDDVKNKIASETKPRLAPDNVGSAFEVDRK